MKIDTDLRLAIKCAERAQPQDNYEARNQHRKESIAALLKLPKYAARYKAAKKEVEKADKIRGKAVAFFDELGINIACDHIRDEPLFYKAGGKMMQRKNRWSYDAVMTQLSSATPQEGAIILKKMGINWK